jgi:MATE family multidrug resistance protein
MSNFIGKKSFRDMKVAGNSAFIMVIAFMSFTAIIFFLFGHQLASFYVKEEIVIVIAVKLLIIAAFFQLADGIQAIGLGTLRGVEDVKIPTIITTINYWFITIPLCYYLGIKLQWGAAGVWYGYLIGLSLVSIALFIRYEYITKKIVKDNLVIVE